MSYLVVFKPAARRFLGQMSRNWQRRIAQKIDQLSLNPRPHGTIKLSGSENMWRIRAGDYRIIYQIFDDRLVVLIIDIGHRREVYR